MKTVWKYPLIVTKEDVFFIEMPAGAEILSLQAQHDHPVIWALVDTDRTYPTTKRWFRIAGTGHPIQDADAMTFVGTFQIHNGQLVFHVFELPEGLLK